jgi:hypothetical protein
LEQGRAGPPSSTATRFFSLETSPYEFTQRSNRSECGDNRPHEKPTDAWFCSRISRGIKPLPELTLPRLIVLAPPSMRCEHRHCTLTQHNAWLHPRMRDSNPIPPRDRTAELVRSSHSRSRHSEKQILDATAEAAPAPVILVANCQKVLYSEAGRLV